MSESGIIHKVKLWENASPESNFEEQSISINISQYEEIEVRFLLWVRISTTEYMLPAIRCKIGKHNKMCCVSPGGDGAIDGKLVGAFRSITALQNSIDISKCKVYSPINTDTTGTTLNNWLIPYEIYGIKT